MSKLSGSIRHHNSGVNVDNVIAAQAKEIAELKAQLQDANKDIETLVVENVEFDTINLVYTFHEVFGHTLGSNQPTDDVLTLRISLIFEELSELAFASGRASYDKMAEECTKFLNTYRKDKKVVVTYDRAEVLDALCDLRVVTDGTVIANNFADIFNAAVTLVHNSNMSKTICTTKEAVDTFQKYENQGVNTDITWKEVNGDAIAIVTRAEDGKILKGIRYEEPDFSILLAETL